MKKIFSLFIFIAICACLSVGAKNGCVTTEKRTAAGAGIGAGAGTLVGLGIGILTGNPTAGAVAGAGVGVLGGTAVAAMTDDKGNELTKAEESEVEKKLIEAKEKYDPKVYGYKIIRDHKGDIDVIFLPKGDPVEEFQLIN